MTAFLAGRKVSLKILTIEDVDENYTRWMNDEKITQFLESRGKSYSIEDLRNYVEKIKESKSDVLFGIFENGNNMHVGNIKIGKIDSFHMHAEVGIMIGEKGCWGKGYGTEAIGLVLKYAFNELCLNKLTAAMYSENVGAFKSFVNNGFRKVGVFRKHVLFKGRYIDMIAVERSRF